MLLVDDDNYQMAWNPAQRYDKRKDLVAKVAEAEPFFVDYEQSTRTVTFKLYPVTWKLVRLKGG